MCRIDGSSSTTGIWIPHGSEKWSVGAGGMGVLRELRDRGKERGNKDKSTGQAGREGGQLGSLVHHR